MEGLNLVSYLAPSMAPFYEAVGVSLAQRLHRNPSFHQSRYDPIDDPELQADAWNIGFICGLPYAQWTSTHPDQLVVLGAPVMDGERYEDRPVYFADVIVRMQSPALTFDDLANMVLCYNEIGSNSGYNLLRNYMIQTQHTTGFWRNTVQSGSHQQSIRWVAEGKADTAAIDSTVLERTMAQQPELASQLRICLSIGPCPMPPIVASARLGSTTTAEIQAALFEPDTGLQAVMRDMGIRRIAPVQADVYLPLKAMHESAVAAGFAEIY